LRSFWLWWVAIDRFDDHRSAVVCRFLLEGIDIVNFAVDFEGVLNDEFPAFEKFKRVCGAHRCTAFPDIAQRSTGQRVKS
jgi:hypothetical protein